MAGSWQGRGRVVAGSWQGGGRVVAGSWQGGGSASECDNLMWQRPGSVCGSAVICEQKCVYIKVKFILYTFVFFGPLE